MRLPLPAQFPDVDLPLDMVARMVISQLQTGVAGTDLVAFHPNGYGLVLIHGRPGIYYNDEARTVEAIVIRMADRDAGLWVPALHTKIHTNGGGTVQGWADGAWIAAALTHLATL